MKIKNILPAFIITLAGFMTSCANEDGVTLLDEVQVSSSYVALPVEGGSNTITVSAKGNWTLEKVTTDKDDVAWLTTSAASGAAGESQITFSAGATLDGRTAEVIIDCGGRKQRINVIQGLSVVSNATCAEVIAGPDSKTYRVTGTVTSIANTEYGNWYLTDETGTIYIYGTLDATGKAKNFLSLGLEVGDEVTVAGPKTTYGSTVELVDVNVITINKSLIKVDSIEGDTIPKDGGVATANVTCKGEGVSVDIPADAQDWLSIASIESAGTGSVIQFKAIPNTGGDRSTTITFRTTSGGREYTSQATIAQAGSIVASSIADFNAAPVSSVQYRLTAVITSIANSNYGNFYIADYSDETYVYGLADFAGTGLKAGDVVTLVGTRGQYNTTIEVLGAVLEASIPVTETSIVDFLAVANTSKDLYRVTGTITEIVNADYGNL
ncbi:MAG: BACON domain-containing protein, partial [Tannerellaceae bacterium]|nr:BACON domain-containing protein [Tannerellaceae bacterium]